MQKKLRIGTKLRKARVEVGITQAQLGALLGVSDKTISGYESNRIYPPIDKLLTITEILNKPINYFLDTESQEHLNARLIAEVNQKLGDIQDILNKIVGQ